ncbi:cor protein [Citrobacter portucalensis]|uniref:phage exclusion lipoprotein Cor n=1 Tax=Citrobacter portucalensis TaxID=1639133 RepID=UPI001EDAD3E4|nr:cor protein [Citrobacter portucalensis]MCC2944636.1 cor protein [Citrobacter freundii]UKK90527.1 cor protein [Citrobacter portucalensis]
MGKLSFLFAAFLLLTGCSGVLEKQEPICDGLALIGGQESLVHIYGVRKVASQTQYRAGYPFNWQWVGKNNFISTSCNKM